MVQDGQLEMGGQHPQKLCLVAVTYNNIAVEQIALGHVDRAANSSQNARRLARLCLSYSVRFLRKIEACHEFALSAARAKFAAGEARRGGEGGGAVVRKKKRGKPKLRIKDG